MSHQPLIVVTGGAGRLGSTVHQTLLAAGKNVRATDRVRSGSSDRSLLLANLLNPGACRRMLKDAQVLVHLAYPREPYECRGVYPGKIFEEQIRLNRCVFEAACKAGIKKIVFASTIRVIARQFPLRGVVLPPSYLPLDENSPVRPDEWYSQAKRCSEEMLAMLHDQASFDCVIFRFPLLVHSNPVPHHGGHQANLSTGFAYLTFRDAANAIHRAIETDLPGFRIYLPASRMNSLRRPAPEIIRDYYDGVPLRKPAAEFDSLVDISTVVRELGWEPLELSQPDWVPGTTWFQRLRKRLLKPIPKPLKQYVKRMLLAPLDRFNR